jgi:hypothetical protein
MWVAVEGRLNEPPFGFQDMTLRLTSAFSFQTSAFSDGE